MAVSEINEVAGSPDRPLLESGLASGWAAQFQRWLEEARAAPGVVAPDVMMLATVGDAGRPSGRTVHLKRVDEDGFVFTSNYGSRKAGEIDANPQVCLVFGWYAVGRQVVVEGAARRTGPAVSDEFYDARSYGPGLGIIASPQSRVIADRSVLERARDELAAEYAGRDIPRPEHLGGYLVVPESVEFWQEQPDRLHDRLRYRRSTGGAWTIERLAP